MKAFYLLASTITFLVAMTAAAWAQWPLGKELSQTQQKHEPGPNLTATGRFQIFISPHIKGLTFMLDTDTGKVWAIEKDHASGNYSLKRISVEEVDAKVPPKSASGDTKSAAEKPSDAK